MADNYEPRDIKRIGDPDDRPSGFVFFEPPEGATDEQVETFMQALYRTIEERGGTLIEDAPAIVSGLALIMEGMAEDGLGQLPIHAPVFYSIMTLANCIQRLVDPLLPEER